MVPLFDREVVKMIAKTFLEVLSITTGGTRSKNC
jgi:hypothetical protein